jgi:hypothetical protein
VLCYAGGIIRPCRSVPARSCLAELTSVKGIVNVTFANIFINYNISKHYAHRQLFVRGSGKIQSHKEYIIYVHVYSHFVL